MVLRSLRAVNAALFSASLLSASLTIGSPLVAFASPGPTPAPAVPEIAAPRDVPFPGTIAIDVDARDVDHRIVRVHETMPVTAGDLTLLYPKWLPGTHAPEGSIDRFAGLEIRAGATPIAWHRDPVDVYAFHITVPNGTRDIAIDFQYLSPPNDAVGTTEFTSNMAFLEPIRLALYPAGYFTRQIMTTMSIGLPAGWQFGSALETQSSAAGITHFKTVTFETLADSPLLAGRYFSRVDLNPGGDVPVHLDMAADRPSVLTMTPAQLAIHRAAVTQARALFGSHHYDHYDFLLALSDSIGGAGLEHHQSSEDSTDTGYFSDYDNESSARDLLTHEYTHSWNGKFRRPFDLWTPDFNVPMRDSLLWVYEGQTEYWGKVLAARAGLRTKDQALDDFASLIARYDARPGRTWRAMDDTTNDEIINPRRPIPWESWQRFEDYYDIGALIWMDADTLIRERSRGARSLDDFARAFFGINDRSFVPVTYTFDDVVRALNAVEPYDWATFLHARVSAVGGALPLDGVRRGGYTLAFTDKQNSYDMSAEKVNKTVDLSYSLGLSVDRDGVISNVQWNGPAFAAGLVKGTKIIAIGGFPYDGDLLKDTVRDAKTFDSPIELIVKRPDTFRTVRIDYRGGLRYPHLERSPGTSPMLDSILSAKGAS